VIGDEGLTPAQWVVYAAEMRRRAAAEAVWWRSLGPQRDVFGQIMTRPGFLPSAEDRAEARALALRTVPRV
jgi:hypothetical protein